MGLFCLTFPVVYLRLTQYSDAGIFVGEMWFNYVDMRKKTLLLPKERGVSRPIVRLWLSKSQVLFFEETDVFSVQNVHMNNSWFWNIEVQTPPVTRGTGLFGVGRESLGIPKRVESNNGFCTPR